ncbi:MAG: succinyl-diaminopimelate desuccinylase, partial [Gaiellales bacterium]|nr:succinyl-diaminopimelate desuccinylase [Gaiellales bacterium]
MPSADELALTERLISYDTSHPDGVVGAMGYLKGWLEGQGIAHRTYDINGLPSIVAAVDGSDPAPAADGSTRPPAVLIWNAHVDVVPARREQFSPWRVDGRLYGRGSYDMKGALAAMLAALADLADARDTIPGVKVKLLIVPDEESDEDSTKVKASAFLAGEGHLGEFVVCGEPTNLEIGVQSKGVLVLRIDVEGRAAHGSTPWLGENAVLKAIALYQQILELPFASGRSELYDRPSINIGRIQGGDVVNKVPDHCRMA